MKVFVSYSHRDAGYLTADSLVGYLKGLEHDGVEFWWDERLVAGEDWDAEIRARIAGTDVALVLVSQSFLDSAYCTDVEISGFLQHARETGLVIFPIILSACEWERHAWLKSRQFLPRGGETIEEHYTDPGRRKRLFHEIRQDLRRQIDRIRQARANPAVQGPVAGTAAPAMAVRGGRTIGEAPRVPEATEARVSVAQELHEALSALAEAGQSSDLQAGRERVAVPPGKRPLAITLVHETGKPRSYTAVYTLDGDLYYGIASSSLRRGSLAALLHAYTETDGARFAERVEPYLARADARDVTLIDDSTFHSLLVRVAGEDRVMVRVQDAAIDASFFGPARTEADDIGVATALGYALIADTMLHAGRKRYEAIKLATIRRLDGTPATGIDERRWLQAFADERVKAFAGRVYELAVRQRTQTYIDLMSADRWNLESPLPVRGFLFVDP